MKLATIVGTRPQFVKAAVIVRAVQEFKTKNSSNPINNILIHTGQHYDYAMSQSFFEELGLPEPAVNLNVRSSSLGAMITSLEKSLLANRPDCVLIIGDTNSTLAGAIVASKLKIPLAHIEAGLRSFNRKMPEEINRIIVDCIADYLFCPCQNAQDQLNKENIFGKKFISGDLLYDSFLYNQNKGVIPKIKEPFALATIHRAENTDNPIRLKSIFSAMKKCPISIVMPLHPRTRKELKRNKVVLDEAIQVIDPLPYLSMLGYLSTCSFVITDSGGLQKEAYFAGKRCLTARGETEWVELIECGVSILVDAFESDTEPIFDWALRPIEKHVNIYGNGTAGDFILNEIAKLLK